MPRPVAARRAKSNVVAPSRVSGMGAVLQKAGTSFRVWAPHAENVFVAGSFNKWSPDAHPMAREDHGLWSIFVPGVKAGDRYRFHIRSGDLDLWRIDPYAREVTSSAGDAIVHDPAFDWRDSGFAMPAWNDLIIYEMHIGTFYSPKGRNPATFDEAAARLPYLRDLGMTAVELLPIMEFPGTTSWGYNLAHPFAVEHAYGGPQALKRFVDAAHRNGIAVILDVVYNHAGPNDLALWRFDGWHEGERGGIYFYQDERAHTPWGDTRFDYGRGEVRQYLRDNVLMWLEDYHVDGLRFDAVAYIRNYAGDNDPAHDLPDGWSLLQWLNSEIDARQPWKITIAEDLFQNEAVTTPVETGGAGFDAQWDPDFVHPIHGVLTTVSDADRHIDTVIASFLHRLNDDAFHRVIYLETHDEVGNDFARLPEAIAPDDADNVFAKKRSTLGAGLLLTAPGIPLFFQGQEFLTPISFDDEKLLDWSEAKQHVGITKLYRDLIALRRDARGVTRGLTGQFASVIHRNPEAHVVAFHRWADGGPRDSTIILANFSNQTLEGYSIGFPAKGTWQVRLNSDWAGYDTDFSDAPLTAIETIAEPQEDQPCRGEIRIGPYSLVILSQDG
jgi:1,4-alpha-glucan branching enzyme